MSTARIVEQGSKYPLMASLPMGFKKSMLSKKKSEGVQGFRLLTAATATVTAPNSPIKARYGDIIASLFAAVKIPPTGLEL